jgi:predicted NBD/HSP70 family sugar kinase
MLHAGLDLSRRKIDVCLLSGTGEHLDQLARSPDADSLRRLARRIDEVHAEPVCAVVESMTRKLSAASSARVGVGHCPHVDVHGDPWAGSLHHPGSPSPSPLRLGAPAVDD